MSEDGEGDHQHSDVPVSVTATALGDSLMGACFGCCSWGKGMSRVSKHRTVNKITHSLTILMDV